MSAVVSRPDWLPLEEFRALSREERAARWLASWNPWLHKPGSRVWRAWEALLSCLSDGAWYLASDVREEMVRAGDLQWHSGYVMLWDATRAGVLEEFRVDGSNRLKKRFVRIHPNAPEHLLRPPAP